MSDQSLREAAQLLREDLAQSYPIRAQYDMASTVIDRLDSMLAAHPAEPVVGDLAARLRASVEAAKARRLGQLMTEPAAVQVEITDEAVEAVMRDLALWDDGCSLPFIEDEVDGGRAAVRHILTVAAPLLGPRPTSCDHSESLHGRCVACGKTWEEQAADRGEIDLPLFQATLEATRSYLASRPLLDREAVKRILGDVRALPVTRSTNPHVEAVMELARPMPTREQIAAALDPVAFRPLRMEDSSYNQRRWMALRDADGVLAQMNGARS